MHAPSHAASLQDASHSVLIHNLDTMDEENDTHRHLCLCSILTDVKGYQWH